MNELHVSMDFKAPAEQVFDAVSDHARFLTGGGAVCRRTREGKPHPNGVGAIREVDAGSLHFEEEILAFDPPRRYDYKIIRLTAKDRPSPVEHELGWVSVEPTATGCRVDWHTRYRVRIPLLGWWVERLVIAPMMRRKFMECLLRVKESPMPAGH